MKKNKEIMKDKKPIFHKRVDRIVARTRRKWEREDDFQLLRMEFYISKEMILDEEACEIFVTDLMPQIKKDFLDKLKQKRVILKKIKQN